MKYYHTSNPIHRNRILKEGLIPKQESWGNSIGSDMNRELGDNKAVFISIGEIYDSTYDDDVYEVVLKNTNNKFYKDKYTGNSIYTLTSISLKNIKLIKKGSISE